MGCDCYPHRLDEPCTCDGCWACSGKTVGCTCDIKWDCTEYDPCPERQREEGLGSCDRCARLATTEVSCWRGCSHWQCDGCAEFTRREAAEEHREITEGNSS